MVVGEPAGAEVEVEPAVEPALLERLAVLRRVLEDRAAAARAPIPGYQAALLYGPSELPALFELERSFDLYIGPKDYGTLSALGRGTDVVMGFDNYFGGRFSGFFASFAAKRQPSWPVLTH